MKSNNPTYTIGEIPDKQSFLTLTAAEKRVESSLRELDKSMGRFSGNDSLQNAGLNKTDFYNNRSRIFITPYKNNKETDQYSDIRSGLPAPCECWFNKDTLFIDMLVGLFGGMGFKIQVVGKQFDTDYLLAIDDVKPYKANLTDSFTNEIFVKSKLQTLTLDKRPTFQEGQQLTGYLTFTSAPFYEQAHDGGLDTNQIAAKVYFTCITRQEFMPAIK